MNYLIELQKMVEEIETLETYNGYFYKVSDVMTKLVESMHWVLDFVFNKDRTTLMENDAQRTLNALRKATLNVIRM